MKGLVIEVCVCACVCFCCWNIASHQLSQAMQKLSAGRGLALCMSFIQISIDHCQFYQLPPSGRLKDALSVAAAPLPATPAHGLPMARL